VYCSHQDFGVCDNCWSYQKAQEDHRRKLDRDARARQADFERERRRAQPSGPTWLDHQAARISSQAAAAKAAKNAARATQPFNLFWYERVAVVAGLLLAVLLLLSELPGWLFLLVLVGGVLAVRRWRDRPLLAVVRMVGRFIRGEQRSPSPRAPRR
jgi:hypothetical protein